MEVWVVVLLKYDALKELNVYKEEIDALDYFDGKLRWLDQQGFHPTATITGKDQKNIACDDGYSLTIRRKDVL